LAAGIKTIVSGCSIVRLVDKDDHGPTDIQDLQKQGINVLGRRHVECFLYDDEVLTALCVRVGKDAEAGGLLTDKADALAASIARGNPSDDIKTATGQIYSSAKKRLGLTGVCNDPASFARNVLAPLVTPDLQTYRDLRRCIFEI